MVKELEGKYVEIIISDPWEFGEAVGEVTFKGKIVKSGMGSNDRPAVLVQLCDPPVFNGVSAS